MKKKKRTDHQKDLLANEWNLTNKETKKKKKKSSSSMNMEQCCHSDFNIFLGHR